MGEEKFTGDKDTVGNVNAENTNLTSAPEEKNSSEQENNGGHSHHHHHRSSSHHHHSSSHHRSGSHSHGHSSRRHRSRIGRWFSKLRRFFRKLNNKKRTTLICAIALAFVMIFSVGVDLVMTVVRNQAEKEAYENESNGDVHGMLNVELINGEGMLVGDAVQRYLSLDLLAEHNKNVMIGNYVEGGIDYNVQNSVGIKFSTTAGIAEMYKIELATNLRYGDAQVDYFAAKEGVHFFEHLYSNTKYYYRVTAYTVAGVVSKEGTFTTADTPRILSIDGLHNVRDIGNWQTDSGKRIKQGLLIRGTELDGAIEREYHLTNEGLYDMLNIYGIKFDMDLRGEHSTPMGRDALGSHVEHKYYDMAMYEDIFTEEGMERVKAVFTDLANEKNYPMYIHCTYGCDRTGTVCFLLEALLGVSRGDCRKDYGLSNLPLEYIIEVEKGLAVYGENLSLREQVEEYLMNSCGITMDQINSIRNIFLGE